MVPLKQSLSLLIIVMVNAITASSSFEAELLKITGEKTESERLARIEIIQLYNLGAKQAKGWDLS